LQPPQIALPNGGGAIQGIGEKFTVNAANGTGTLSVPIAASRGRSGFGPQLSLSYNSGSGNGPFGFGWSLETPAITRKTDKGLPRYADFRESDVFILSGAEDLVPVPDAPPGRTRTVNKVRYTIVQYRPRVESLFARIERWTSDKGETHWRTISRDNVTTLYGIDDNSRIQDHAADAKHPNDQPRVFSYLISRTFDDKGNIAVYDYVAESTSDIHTWLAHEANRSNIDRTRQRYLKSIRYGNVEPYFPDWSETAKEAPLPTAWHFELVLDYGNHSSNAPQPAPDQPLELRPDPFSSYRAGFEVRTYRRCKRVLMFHHFPDADIGDNCLVHSTDFKYSDEQAAPDPRSPIYTFLQSITHTGYLAKGTVYARKSMPPLEFAYSPLPTIPSEVLSLDADSAANLPQGLDGGRYQWVDLDGEGASGVLCDEQGAWGYRRNLSPANRVRQPDGTRATRVRLGPLEPVTALPWRNALGALRLMDLSGDGQLDVVALDEPDAGFFERTEHMDWAPFRRFERLPQLDWQQPNLKFVDLTGDGLADVLFTEDGMFTFYPSRGAKGFGEGERVSVPWDEERGPKVVLADGTETIFLADMSGDGLSDLVRVRNGEVCYWPNLGYGRFGAKVAMDSAPRFVDEERFDPRRVRLADIDGSGTSDLIYVGADGVQVCFNQSGNAWAIPQPLAVFPGADDLSSVQVLDLLGRGTACLVWSSPLPGEARVPLRYVDLMGREKPHLLIHMRNNLGAETHVGYAPSTQFYVADEMARRPWVTRLPHVVHVVERVETYDFVGRNRFVSHYAFHHGFYDGFEREFRGFGMVEKWDTERHGDNTDFPGAADANWAAASWTPPTLTRSWFHTGAFIEAGKVSWHYAHEYWVEPALRDDLSLSAAERAKRAAARDAMLLPDTVLDNADGLLPDEMREAYRALKGVALRVEVYGEDGSPKAGHPYTVTEQNFAVRMLQARGLNRHAVFFVHPRETLSYHYERDPADPRVAHTLTLDVDPYGNVRRSLSIGYGRRPGQSPLQGDDRTKQERLLAIYTQNDFTNAIDDRAAYPDVYRTPLPAETRTYEVTGVAPGKNATRFAFADFAADAFQPLDGLAEIQYEDPADQTRQQKRLIERVRTLYRRNDLSDFLALGKLEMLALLGETYRQAFTPGLAKQIFVDSGKLSQPELNAALGDDGRYVHSLGDAAWWVPSGRMFYSPRSADTPLQELAYAAQHFFLPLRYRDPFHTPAAPTEVVVDYDPYDLLVQETRDPLGNRVTAGTRKPDDSLAKQGNDYRVLKPRLTMDPNRNCAAVAYDMLGFVVGTAVMGAPEDSPAQGDLLDPSFETDLDSSDVDLFYGDPLGRAPGALANATTRIIYDLDRYRRSHIANPTDPTKWEATFAATLTRETHKANPLPPGGLRIQVSFSYSDGFGREIQRKMQAEQGPAPTRDTKGRIAVGSDGQPAMSAKPAKSRWVGSGWTVFNNKGKPVLTFEPFFSDTHKPDFDTRIGVSTVLFYDPVERVVATLHPNGTYEKIVPGPWRQATHDVNDTVAADPRTDPDVAGLVPSYFAAQPAGWKTWLEQRIADPQHPPPDTKGQAPEQDAAVRALAHADTPSIAHFDALARTILTLADNGPDPASAGRHLLYATRVVIDIEGNQRQVVDATGRIVMVYDYDMLGHRVHQSSMEAGARWMLNDVAGKPAHAWDSRGHAFRSKYDQLRRPVRQYVRGTDVANSDPDTLSKEVLFEQIEYGEAQPNMRTRVYRLFDGAGRVTNLKYDFKGNLLGSKREIAQHYKTLLDWSAPVALGDSYNAATAYDALNRSIALTAPDGSVVRPTYNEAKLLERVDVNLRGAATTPPFVTNLDYDAKGQRTRIDYGTQDGRGISTTYRYDPLTFRLAAMTTARNDPTFDADDRPGEVQNLFYTYDPIGNITHIRDDAQDTIFFKNQQIEPSNDYVYDAICRLLSATGREHLGQTGAPIPHSYNDAGRTGLVSPGTPSFAPDDRKAMGRYREAYQYDEVGNLLTMAHIRTDATAANWTRSYTYNEASQLERAHRSNRLTSTNFADGTYETYSVMGNGYDPHGNMQRMPHLQIMQWNFKDRLLVTQRQSVNASDDDGAAHRGEMTYYVYDAGGQRVRKVTERQAAAGRTPTRLKERIYVGGFEVYREYGGDGATVTLERETLHVMDDKKRIALVETKTIDGGAAVRSPTSLIRYQLGNHLGSTSLELDDQAQMISYEEYTPYGSTSYQAVRGQTEAPKRYRYTGKERDEESGLNYHRARYYAPSLGRWCSSDPIGIGDDLNTFAYVACNPCSRGDPTGKIGEPEQMHLTEQTDLRQMCTATDSGRGYGQYLRKTFQSLGSQWMRGPIDVGDPEDLPFAITRPGTTRGLFAQPRPENQEIGRKIIKPLVKGAREAGETVRTDDGWPGGKKGTVYGQPPENPKLEGLAGSDRLHQTKFDFPEPDKPPSNTGPAPVQSEFDFSSTATGPQQSAPGPSLASAAPAASTASAGSPVGAAVPPSVSAPTAAPAPTGVHPPGPAPASPEIEQMSSEATGNWTTKIGPVGEAVGTAATGGFMVIGTAGTIVEAAAAAQKGEAAKTTFYAASAAGQATGTIMWGAGWIAGDEAAMALGAGIFGLSALPAAMIAALLPGSAE
jgi:RHS repeat-associated protein